MIDFESMSRPDFESFITAAKTGVLPEVPMDRVQLATQIASVLERDDQEDL